MADDIKLEKDISFLHATAGTAIARLSHSNSVCPSVCHKGESVKYGAN